MNSSSTNGRIPPTRLQRKVPSFLCAVVLLIVGAIATAAALSAAEDTPGARVTHAAQATGFVEIWINDEFVASGSCFCFDEKGFFVTNNHVVNWPGLSPAIFVVLNSGTAEEHRFPATLLKSSAELDLALLQLKSDKAFPFIALARNPVVKETQSVTAIGFPRGREKSKRTDLNPPVTITQGKVTALQNNTAGDLQRVQFNADVDHGSSGGPLLNHAGEVIGAVVAGYVGHDINMAIPVEQIIPFLQQPEISITPAFIATNQLGTKVLVKSNISALHQAPEMFDLKLLITGAPGTPDRETALTWADGAFVGQVAIPSSTELSSRIEVEMEFEDGILHGNMENLPLVVGEQKVSLGQTVLVQPISPGQVVLAQGGPLTGTIQPLGPTAVQVGSQTITLDLSKARSIKCLSTPEITSLHCRLRAYQKGICVAETKREILIRDESPRERFTNISGSNPEAGKLGHIHPPPASSMGILTLPDRIHDMSTAAGGRFLLLQFPARKSIAIFDVNNAKIVKELIFADPNILFTGGADCLIVFSPASNTLERWSLLTYQQTNKKEFTKDRDVKAIVMGCDSPGPLMVCSSKKGDDYSSADFLAVSDFSVTHSVVPNKWAMGNYHSIHLRASANGKTFAAWCTQITPFGLHILRLSGKEVSYAYDGCDVGWILPAADGGRVHVFDTSYFISHCGRLFGPDNKELQWSVDKDSFVLPAQRGNLCLAIDGRTRHEMSLFRDGGTTPLAHLGIRFSATYNSYLRSDFWIDKKLYLIPDAELLISVLDTGRHLVLTPIPFTRILKREAATTGRALPPTTQDPE